MTRRPVLDAVNRLRDIVVALLVLFLAAPILAAAVVAVRMAMGRSVLFRQQRLGRGGDPFMMLKLRTMRDPLPGREGSAYDAERLTALGSLLRKTSIDEIPSFLNLLRGDITLVGPRPLPVHYWDRFIDEEYRRFDVRPGITGQAQVKGRNTIGWNERLALDVSYVSNRSFLGDLRIIAKTVPVVLTAQGVNEQTGQTMQELPVERRIGDRRSGYDRRSTPRDTPDRRASGRRLSDQAS